jgi:hypothetical protein
MEKAIVVVVCIVLLTIMVPSRVASAETEGFIIREISDHDPDPGDVITVTIRPIGIDSFYAVEEHLGLLSYSGEHTADSNPEGTIFTMLTPTSFTYTVRVPGGPGGDLIVGELPITGEFWTDPGEKKDIGETVIGAPRVSVAPSYQEVGPGESFSVDIWIYPSGEGVSAASIVLTYDSGAVLVDGVEMGSFLGDEPLVPAGFPKTDTLGTVRIDAARRGATSVPTLPGVFASITLTARDEAKLLDKWGTRKPGKVISVPYAWAVPNYYGYSNLAFTEAELVDENALDIGGVETTNGVVRITRATEIMPGIPDPNEEDQVQDKADEAGECPRWDINEDCIVDYRDLAILSLHYDEATQSPYPRWDINEDSAAELRDLSLLGAHFEDIACECSIAMRTEIERIPPILHPQLQNLPWK